LKYRSLGRTGVKVSPLSLGCFNFGGATEPEESYRIIDRAIDAGINFLDTANTYGKSETVVGEALQRNGKREQIVLGTKVHGHMDPDDPNMHGNSRRHIIQQCEASLKRLQTDYIDLYQLHRPQSDIPIDETLRALDDLIRSGKVRYIGTSSFASWEIMEALWVAKELGLNRFVCEQPAYNILDRRIESELLPMTQTYGLATIVWSPLAAGLLSGKYKRNMEPPKESRFGDFKKSDWMRSCFNDQLFDVLEGLESLLADKEMTLSQFALAWSIRQEGVTSAIIGPRTTDQLEDNLKAIDTQVSYEDCLQVDKLAASGTLTTPVYDMRPRAKQPHSYAW
jgi:aryl-alcohol dehydrogenase-like predicted oxidoreductase